MQKALTLAAAIVLAVVGVAPTTATAEPAAIESETVAPRPIAPVGLTPAGVLQGKARVRNKAPVITSNGGGKNTSIRLFEGTTVVTDVEATDPDGDTEGAGLTYSLTGGSDAEAFSIDHDFGVLEFTSPPDFESPTDSNLDNRYVVRVQVTDSGGATDRQLIRVIVRDLQGAPAITSDGGGATAALTVTEGTTPVTDVEAIDPDGDTEGAGLAYALSGADGGAFTIDPDTGLVTFASPPDFENPTDVGGTPGDNVYAVTVTVTDSTGLADSQDLSITVTKQAEAPSEMAKLVAADGATTALFGYSVAISGNTAVVGAVIADNYTGAAYVFTRNEGVWDAGTKLIAAGRTGADFFGSSVAISGDTLVVGATGSAYVFARDGGAWDDGTKLVAGGGGEFGSPVAISGDTVVVGAAGDDHAGSDSGSAYVFTRNGGAWDSGTKLVAFDGSAGDRFGSAVAISGDTVVVGAGTDDNAGATASGSAYVFTRNGGAWDSGTKLVAFDGSAGDRFGSAVAISGGTVVVGAGTDDNAGATASGSAYVFTRNGAVWDAGTKLVAADAAALDFFGLSVAISGDTAVIGAQFSDGAGINSGSAYVFTRSGGAWDAGAKLVPADSSATDEFGTSVAISDGTVLVGAAFEDNAGGTDAGSAYVFGSP